MAQPKAGDRGTKLSMRVGDKHVDVAIRVARIETLTHHPANPRKHGPSNLAAIKQSLQAFGQRYPIVINDQGQVLAGNGRLDVMRELGWAEVMVAEADLSSADQLAFMVADNRSSELAEWDDEALATILKGMRDMGALTRTGYDEESLNVLLGQLHQDTMPAVTEDQAPPPC